MGQLENKLKKRSLRVTAARKALYREMIRCNKALTPRELSRILDKEQPDSSDQASIYRNLSLFEDLGLVNQIQNGRYAVCQHQEEDCCPTAHHMHTVALCNVCGKTAEVKDQCKSLNKWSKELEALVKNFSNFQGLTLQGICKDCNS